MPTSPNEDGRPTQGGAAAPVHVMNPISVTLTGTIPGTVEIANDSGNPVPVSGTVTADTELPAAAALADATANPTAPAVASFGHGFNGTTWDRIRTAIGDAMAATGLLGFVTMLWNGATFDRWKGDNTGAARVSMYGKGSVTAIAGDTPAVITPTGRVYVTAIGALSVLGDGASNNGAFFRSSDDGERIVAIAPYNNNGSSWDRVRNNHEVTVLASAARTALVNSADLTNYNARGVIVTVDITAFTSGGLTCTIKYKDSLSGKYVTLLASAVLAAAATTMLVVFPGVTVAANLAASAPLPRVWRVEMTVNDATSITYSVSANYIN